MLKNHNPVLSTGYNSIPRRLSPTHACMTPRWTGEIYGKVPSLVPQRVNLRPPRVHTSIVASPVIFSRFFLGNAVADLDEEDKGDEDNDDEDAEETDFKKPGAKQTEGMKTILPTAVAADVTLLQILPAGSNTPISHQLVTEDLVVYIDPTTTATINSIPTTSQYTIFENRSGVCYNHSD
ncbi:hypothetical protein BD779DRAFT_1582333 [Infundibulicybe gibba]|nr:hypothetical protein BD779DRAFT_1582333 [Infundibulicybe gibba]